MCNKLSEYIKGKNIARLSFGVSQRSFISAFWNAAWSGNPQTGTVEVGLLHFQVRLGWRRKSNIISTPNKIPSPTFSPPDDKCICLHELLTANA